MEGKVEVDLSKHTDAQVDNHRPNMIVTLGTYMYILEVACTWDSIVREREMVNIEHWLRISNPSTPPRESTTWPWWSETWVP